MWECYHHLDIWTRWIGLANSRFAPALALSGWSRGFFFCLMICLVHPSPAPSFCPPLSITTSGVFRLLQRQQPLHCSHCSPCSPQRVSFHRGCANPVVLHHIVIVATGMCLQMSPSKREKCVSSCLCLQHVRSALLPQPLPTTCILPAGAVPAARLKPKLPPPLQWVCEGNGIVQVGRRAALVCVQKEGSRDVQGGKLASASTLMMPLSRTQLNVKISP